MTTFDLAKQNHDKGLWSKEMLKKLVANNKLTVGEYKTITGEKYIA